MRKYSATVAVQPEVPAIVEHGLGTTDIVIGVYDRDGREVRCSLVRYDLDTIALTTDHRDEVRVVVIG